MANTTRPYGFRPQRYLSGAAWNGQTQLYGFSASQANDAYKGDVVKVDTTNRSTALTDAYAPGIPFVAPCVAAQTTTVIRGIIAGFVPAPEFSQTATASLGTMYRAASTARYGWVVDDPSVIFEAEEAGNSYTSASSNAINKGMDITYAAGSTLTGISGVKLSGTAVTTQIAFRCLRYTQRVDNFNFTSADTSSRAHWDVMISNGDLSQVGAVTVGA